jgi:hypothetical protein
MDRPVTQMRFVARGDADALGAMHVASGHETYELFPGRRQQLV